MKLKTILSTLFLVATIITSAQTKFLFIPANIQLPKDTVVTNLLIKSLNDFLSQKEKPNKDNTYVLKEDLLETSILLDEMKGVEKSNKFKDENFYKGYLTNVLPLDKDNFVIQFSYIGVNENIPILIASFEILGKQKDGKFYFLSPLKRNTALWESKKVGNTVFHSKNGLDKDISKKYSDAVAAVDAKLGKQDYKREWYGCNNFLELLEAIGVKYSLPYNSISSGTLSATENDVSLMFISSKYANFYSISTHELFHERAGMLIPEDKINRNMVCGYAFNFGDWGLSWKEICMQFKADKHNLPNNDWLELYFGGYNFAKNKEEHLYLNSFINTLIVQKLEKEKGFPAVMELLASGNSKKDKNNFFKILEKQTGINEVNFNEKVGELMRENKLL